MGQPAARAIIDIAAHGGIILTGSSDVFIGGFPAARINDTVFCGNHPVSSIKSGSESVFINGRSAARKCDNTCCMVSSPLSSPTTAPPQYISISPNGVQPNDGAIKDDLIEARVVDVYGGREDINNNGTYDTLKFGVALADVTVGNMDDDNAMFRAGGNVSAFKADGTLGLYYDKGMKGFDASGSAVITHKEISLGLGKKSDNLYADLNGSVDLAKAEAAAKVISYDGSEGKWGFEGKVGAKAVSAEAQGKTNFSLFGVIQGDASVTAGTPGVGAMVEGGVYLDKNDLSFNVSLGGDIAPVIAELGIDFNLKISLQPIADLLGGGKDNNDDINNIISFVDGVILTGCDTVLLG